MMNLPVGRQTRMNADKKLLISCLCPDDAEPLECGVSPEGAPSPLWAHREGDSRAPIIDELA
jgi:hypothetical protein